MSVNAPTRRPREARATVITDLTPRPRRNSRSSGSCAIELQVLVGDPLPEARLDQAGVVAADDLLGKRGLALHQQLLELLPLRAGGTDRDPVDATVGDDVDHAVVGELRDDQVADQPHRHRQRSGPVGDRGGVVEEGEATHAQPRFVDRPGCQHRESGPGGDDRNPHEIGVVGEVRVPEPAERRQSNREDRGHRGCPAPSGESGDEGGHRIGGRDRVGGEQQVDDHQRRQHGEAGAQSAPLDPDDPMDL